ncbi:hypothetical protein AB0J01_38055 [Streptomyces sp. NPDC050204]|uniref:hypothetical protein n=1 Tax=Streptomyces sp. NPDC050204 TaxID=3155514 RepID=UPI0034466840
MDHLLPSPPPASPPAAALPAAAQAPTGRLGPTHTLILLIAILTLGTALFLRGTPLGDVFLLLGGCGAIGAGTLTAAGGGRRLMAVLVETAVRSGTGK